MDKKKMKTNAKAKPLAAEPSAKTPAQRQQERRARLAATKGRYVQVMLTPAAGKAMDKLTARGATITDVVNAAVLAMGKPAK